jgi:hypothetical protein
LSLGKITPHAVHVYVLSDSGRRLALAPQELQSVVVWAGGTSRRSRPCLAAMLISSCLAAEAAASAAFLAIVVFITNLGR